MKRIIRCLMPALFALTTMLSAYAVPATPNPIPVSMPDGSLQTVTLVGDEYGFTMLDSDGNQVAPVKSLRCTPMGEKQISNVKRRIKTSNFPTYGNQKSLVILVEFTDVKFSSIPDAYDYYNRMLNEEGFSWNNGADGSARDFFVSSSCGKFTPEFKVVGPVTLPHDSEYYGADGEYLDENVVNMILDAAQSADSLVDFSEYDADGDGCVDNIYIFYAGYGQADSGKQNAIWPHSGYIEDWGAELTLDGVKLNRYACSNEIRFDTVPNFLPVGIGTFVHEFSHVLGLADHYDATMKSGRLAVSKWDTMGTGAYLNNQNTPPLYSAFEKAELGWLDYTTLNGLTPGWLSLPPLDAGNMAYRIDVDGTGCREYFILEYRRNEGWDKYLPGSGMLVWHVDMDEQRWTSNTVNTDPTHQYLDIIEADGRESESTLAGDTFPGADNISSFGFADWHGNNCFELDYLVQSDDEIRFLLGSTNFQPEKPELELERVGGHTVEFSWNHINGTQFYVASITDENGNTLPECNSRKFSNVESVSISTLLPSTTYRLDLGVQMGSYESEKGTLEFTTADAPCFFELTPEGFFADEISSDGFQLNWEPMPNVYAYRISLDEVSFEAPVDVKCDYTVIPEGFISSSNKINKAFFGYEAPSLQLDNNEDYVAYSASNAEITSVSFWVKSQSATNYISVEYRLPGVDNWIQVANQKLKNGASTFEFDIPGASEVRLVYEKKSGFILIDDFTCTVTPVSRVPVYIKSIHFMECLDEESNVCKYVISGLKGNTVYDASLCGFSEYLMPTDIKSDEDDYEDADTEYTRKAVIRVSTLPGSGVKSVAEADNTIRRFDLMGHPVKEDAKGIYLEVRSDGTCRKVLNK